MAHRTVVSGLAVVALAVGAIVGIQALAADLNPSQIGAYCAPGETGAWHFVNNQTRTTSPGTLTVAFADAGTLTFAPDQVNRNIQGPRATSPRIPW